MSLLLVYLVFWFLLLWPLAWVGGMFGPVGDGVIVAWLAVLSFILLAWYVTSGVP